MACNPISAGSTFCDNIRPAGIDPSIYLIPLADWKNSTVTVDGTSNNITAITLPSGGKQAYLFECGQPSNLIVTSPATPVAGGLNGYRPQVDMKLVAKDQALIDNIIKLWYNKVVVIVPLQNGDARVYGGYADSTPEPQGGGLKKIGGDDIPGDATVGGLIQLILANDPDGPAERYPYHVVDSTVDLTALLTPTA